MVAAVEAQNLHLFLAGIHTSSASGETFTVSNPALNKPIAQVAKAGREDVDRAISAARKAFDEGPWPRMSATERGRVVRKIGEVIKDRVDELARLESLNTGKPL